MKMKKLVAVGMAMALSLASAFTAMAGWIQDGSNWRYQNSDNTWQAGNWFKDTTGKWYHFDQNGVMQTGWFQDKDGKWYFLSYNGDMQANTLIVVDGKTYFLNPSGDVFSGEKTFDGRKYTFTVNGTVGGAPSTANIGWGGNGNRTTATLGGGIKAPSDSATPPSRPTPPTPQQQAVGNINESIMGSAAGLADKGVTVETPVVNSDGTVDVAVALGPNYDQGAVKTAVASVVKETVKTADVGKDVTIKLPKQPEQTVQKTSDGKVTGKNPVTGKDVTKTVDEWVNWYVSQFGIDSLKGPTTITVPINGQDVVYNIKAPTQ